ncbi:hypothetical protein BJ912DRAFT_1143160 [Pholiota molesta]|nr:hypothetical protein BJ912DRAFT_1143160 [Pholiota molesta]
MLRAGQKMPLRTFVVLSALISQALSTSSSSSEAFPFSPGFDIESVVSIAVALPSHTWEFGTASEALLELYDAPHAVYGDSPFPVPTIQPADSPSLTYAQKTMVLGSNGLNNGNGAVGDPASQGVFALLLGQTNATYAQAADAEIAYVLNDAPRWWNGAISHRAQYAELWYGGLHLHGSPFLAYYGVATNNATILKTAADQCVLYQQALVANTTATDPSPPTTHPVNASGLWTHILGPVSDDPGIWSTGNAWAAAGTMRVLATLIKAPRSLFSAQGPATQAWRLEAIIDLTDIVRSILDGAINASPDQGLLRNYMDDQTWFGEISGSSMLASVAYRLATMSCKSPFLQLSTGDVQKYIAFAEGVRTTLGTANI